ncbi:hypothetical protein LCGC14_1144170 [marine sediment metagenome]|uniref:Uncharacterized protein n=1 Tax=marine sediment metagenome TaxID=412755 RepID=A0A0F9PFK4_9ZZZZ
MKKVAEHTCHYCEQERKLEVIEKYPCGARLVLDSMIGVCCSCKIRWVMWGAKPVLRGKNEPDRECDNDKTL